MLSGIEIAFVVFIILYILLTVIDKILGREVVKLNNELMNRLRKRINDLENNQDKIMLRQKEINRMMK